MTGFDQYLDQRGLSYAAAAAALGYSRSVVSRAAREGRASRRFIERAIRWSGGVLRFEDFVAKDKAADDGEAA